MVTSDREYRAFEMQASAEESQMVVEGYAAIFNSPTILWSDGDIDYSEVVEPTAFDNAQMADVVMNYNHKGKPVARTKNNTLELKVDATGLHIRAYLGGTDEGRELYNEIKGGYIDKMSFAFTVSEETYDRDTHTRHITGIKRLYDVAAVDIPAYDATSISARNFFTAEVEKEKIAEAREAQKRRIKLLLEAGK